MGKVFDIIEQNKTNTRKSKNAELHIALIRAICSDKEYVAKFAKEVLPNGEPIIENKRLSESFIKFIASILKKNTTLTESEAIEIASNIELTHDQAVMIRDIVREADYIAIKDCGKKIPLFEKDDVQATLGMTMKKESIRPNPQNRSCSIRIAAHPRVQVYQKLFDNQKSTIRAKK